MFRYRRSLPSGLLICLAFVGTVFGPRRGAESAPLYGFTAFPHEFSFEAIDELHDVILPNSNLYAIHMDSCVPWKQALESVQSGDRGVRLPSWMEQEWEGTKNRIPGAHVVYTSITPTQQDRRSVAEPCGSTEGTPGVMPPELRGRSFDDELLQRAYLAYARHVVQQFEPTYLINGIEMSELSLNAPEEWAAFEELADFTRDELKREFPALQVGIEYVLQSLLTPRVGAQVKPVMERGDFLGISFYPYGSEFGVLHGTPPLPDPPDQWRQPLEWLRTYTDIPLAIAETGYTTQDVNAVGLQFPGDKDLQRAFLSDLIEVVKRDEYLFLVWFIAIDYTKLLEQLPFAVDFLEIWAHTGLLDSALRPKPAWEVWQREFVEVPALQAGDANMDFAFDQLDLIQVQIAAKYFTGQPATWGEGDWNGAPGGMPGFPPAGDGLFDQRDIIAALTTRLYRTGPYAGLGLDRHRGPTSIIHDANTGEFYIPEPSTIVLLGIGLGALLSYGIRNAKFR